MKPNLTEMRTLCTHKLVDIALKVLDGGRAAGRRFQLRCLIHGDPRHPAPQRCRHNFASTPIWAVARGNDNCNSTVVSRDGLKDRNYMCCGYFVGPVRSPCFHLVTLLSVVGKSALTRREADRSLNHLPRLTRPSASIAPGNQSGEQSGLVEWKSH